MSGFENVRLDVDRIPKSCPKCGKKFDCLGEDCWCHNYQILNKNIHFIRQSWNDCLCPGCLKEFAENKEQL